MVDDAGDAEESRRAAHLGQVVEQKGEDEAGAHAHEPHEEQEGGHFGRRAVLEQLAVLAGPGRARLVRGLEVVRAALVGLWFVHQNLGLELFFGPALQAAGH